MLGDAGQGREPSVPEAAKHLESSAAQREGAGFAQALEVVRSGCRPVLATWPFRETMLLTTGGLTQHRRIALHPA
jgi:hypothetical protein